MDGTDFESLACGEEVNPSLPDHIHTGYPPNEVADLAAANQCIEPYATNIHSAAYPEGDVPNFLTQLATSNAPLSQAFCPHCGCFLNDISSTQTQQDVHIQQCKDMYNGSELEPIQEAENNIQSEAEEHSDDNDDEEEREEEQEREQQQQQQQQQQPFSFENEEELDDVDLTHSPTTTTTTTNTNTNTNPDDALLQSWLDHHNLTKHTALFTQAGADLKLIPLLTDTDLRHMGITALGARKKILFAAHDLIKIQQHTSQNTLHIDNDDDNNNNDDDDVGGNSLKRYFPLLNPPPEKKKQKNNNNNHGSTAALPPPPGSILNFVHVPPGAKIPPPKPPPNNNKNSNSNAWAHKEATTTTAANGAKTNTTKTRRGFASSSRGPQPYKSWQLIPGTTFVVDRFNNLPPPSQHQTHWFLTHFHADHYRGLTGKWNRGPIYCTAITAALVKSQLRVRDEWIRVVEELDVGVEVEGSVVTFIDANHCPGAVMIVFEGGRGGEGGEEGGGEEGGGRGVVVRRRRRPVLHTGDARLIASMQDHPVLNRLRGSKCDLTLDTTYANPEYDFPSQQDALQFAMDAVKAEAFNGNQTLFLFGSYTIGKERLYLEAARMLNRKIYVSATKKKVLDCLNLDAHTQGLLTTDDTATNLHAVPLWMVSQKHMANVLKHYKGRFTTVVGFQPTGWTHGRESGTTKKGIKKGSSSSSASRGKRRQKGTLIVYSVPYSEHSSFTELKAFVRWLAPINIVPHVNADCNGPKAAALVNLLRS